MPTVRFHAPGESLSTRQQAALYYARKRRRERAEASERHDVLTRYRQYLGMQFVVVLDVSPA